MISSETASEAEDRLIWLAVGSRVNRT